jgi:hypothetical protein
MIFSLADGQEKLCKPCEVWFDGSLLLTGTKVYLQSMNVWHV